MEAWEMQQRLVLDELFDADSFSKFNIKLIGLSVGEVFCNRTSAGCAERIPHALKQNDRVRFYPHADLEVSV